MSDDGLYRYQYSEAEIKKGYYSAVVKILANNGWKLERSGKGSHDIWSKDNNKVTVPYNLDNRHTANGILKQAGINEKV
ncbi:type II toxin-antitoxin system HicA family toxin [Morganella sp. GD04133]|uniref:type II toxin-antitoxin system HicA family toxin n=1 Tax=Morganella sp. GD04133 TaxID=2975435 RepID=UPI0024473F07|nr:type II toxin-antitoxin system HicA family toxin [Morganella sp. GD04133]MDH0356613.1 type II toxin-antitoxin system HicA family toxin [Morganella sp. GD04133]